jgi:hypothetical protein
MSKTIQFGENVKGFNCAVLNEREVRASAGLLFLFAFLSLLLIIFTANFILAKFFVVFFLLDFIIRVLVNPRFSPSLILGRLIVSNQQPEYVGAPQKKFAWTIGLVMGAVMFVLMVVMNTYSFITGIICLICLLFLFFESAFGICLGCIFYKYFYKKEIQLCPGDSCETKEKEEIQKVSKPQWLIFIGFILFIVLSVYLLKDPFQPKPENLWEKLGIKKEVSSNLP